MKITATYDYRSYSKLMTTLFYRQIRAYVVVILGVLFIGSGFFFLVVVPGNYLSKSVFFAVGLLLVFLPFFTSKLVAKRSFFSNKMLQEKLSFEFLGNKIVTTGTSFRSEMEWSSVYLVKELKDWFLIYHSKQLFYMIPKSDLNEKRSAFEALVKNQQGLKYAFRKK